MEVFKFTVLSSEEARSHGVKALCLVDKRWNNIANRTSDLWTKVTFAYPLRARQLSVANKRLRASKQKIIDLEIDLCEPDSSELRGGDWYPLVKSAQIRNTIKTLRGSEHRWRSLSIMSNTRKPAHEFLQEWGTLSLPELESISFDGPGRPSMEHAFSADFGWPVVFCGKWSLMPKLREVSLSAVCFYWSSVAATSVRNLRKLEIKNQPHGFGPTWEEFAALLAAAPRLEILDVSGYSPSPIQTQILPVHLPALKRFVFGWNWNRVDLVYKFLRVFQISETLELLSLVDVDSGLYQIEDTEDLAVQSANSSRIFKLLTDLASEGSKDKDPLRPWISMLGLKSLSVSWLTSDPRDITAFLHKAPKIEEIRLTDVSQRVLHGIADFAAETWLTRSLKRVYIQWIWNKGGGARPWINTLEGLGLQVTVEGFTE